MQKKPKFNVHERDQIAVWLALKIPFREMARRLNRSVSSISDEIRRNSVEGTYSAHAAQVIADGRNQKSRKQNPLKDRIH